MLLAALGRSYGPNPWIAICSMTLLSIVYFTAIIIWVLRRTKAKQPKPRPKPGSPQDSD